MAKVINAAIVAEEKMKNGEMREAKVYRGTANGNLAGTAVDLYGSEKYKLAGAKWKNSAGYNALWNDIYQMQGKIKTANAANPVDPTTLAGYFAKLFIDVERNMDDLLDITPFVAMVIRNEMAQEISYLRDWLPYIGKEKIISGTNDMVPLIDQKTAAVEQIQLYVRAFGWKDSIKNMAFAPINVLQRVTEAAARIAVDYKNAQIMDPINAASTTGFGAKHSQAADATGSTFDLKMYNTLRQAQKKLGTLIHPMYTNRLVSSLPGYASPTLLCHPNNLWDIQRVVSGFTAGGFVQDVAPLPIGSIVPYACGIQHGETWGEETLSLPGVAENVAFMLIPDQAMILDKRDVTLEVGTGSVLELSTEERSWHRISGTNTSYLIGGATTNTGKGCIVKIALPTE
jgi:hypothetical protein